MESSVKDMVSMNWRKGYGLLILSTLAFTIYVLKKVLYGVINCEPWTEPNWHALWSKNAAKSAQALNRFT